jgi:hypothetical protein
MQRRSVSRAVGWVEDPVVVAWGHRLVSMGESNGSKDPVLVLRRHSNGTKKHSMDSKQPSVSSDQLRVISCPNVVFVQDQVVFVRTSAMSLDDENGPSK